MCMAQSGGDYWEKQRAAQGVAHASGHKQSSEMQAVAPPACWRANCRRLCGLAQAQGSDHPHGRHTEDSIPEPAASVWRAAQSVAAGRGSRLPAAHHIRPVGNRPQERAFSFMSSGIASFQCLCSSAASCEPGFDTRLRRTRFTLRRYSLPPPLLLSAATTADGGSPIKSASQATSSYTTL
jgi:hypothetical protein